MKVGDRVRIQNTVYFNGVVGTITKYTCATARYVKFDTTGLEFNFHITDLELIIEPAQDSYMELFL